jgi:hypothetical protein
MVDQKSQGDDHNPDGWTFSTLYKHIMMLSDASKEAITAAMASAEKAVTKADLANEKRFDCVTADTPILCADLVWRPAGTLCVGDELLAFDEKAPSRRGRRFRRATVTANSIASDKLLRVNTTSGTVRCNHKHPWLVRRGNKTVEWRWVKSDELRVGDAVYHPLDVWETDTSWEGGWLAGMYDGEGCLSHSNNRSNLSIAQRESPTSAMIERELKRRSEHICIHRREPSKSHWQVQYHFIVTAVADVLRILGTVRPPRLLFTSDKAWEGKPIGGWHRSALVTAINAIEDDQIAMLSTSTKTYIAAGFAMHNSVNEFRAAMKDQQATFADKEQTNRRLNLLESAQATQSGKERGIGMIGSVAIGVSIVLSGVIAAIGLFYGFSHH